MAEQFWAACRTFTGREHIVRAKIEEGDRGAFLPTYVRSWISDGKETTTERAAVPGYVFFRVNGEDWPPVRNMDDVIGVLMDGDQIARIHGSEMAGIVIDHAAGTHNRFEGRFAAKVRRKSRKPRPSKRARFA